MNRPFIRRKETNDKRKISGCYENFNQIFCSYVIKVCSFSYQTVQVKEENLQLFRILIDKALTSILSRSKAKTQITSKDRNYGKSRQILL